MLIKLATFPHKNYLKVLIDSPRDCRKICANYKRYVQNVTAIPRVYISLTMKLQRVVDVIRASPLVRGMASYGIIWPCSNFMQQTVVEKRNFSDYDYARAFRFFLYATLIQSPTLYGFVKLSSLMFPRPGIRTALKKVCTEQILFEPGSVALFFISMALMEGKSLEEAQEVMTAKWRATYQMSCVFWPAFQTMNFYYVPEANRVPVVSIGSFGWSCFLAYMDYAD